MKELTEEQKKAVENRVKNEVKPTFDIHFTTQSIKEIEDRAKSGFLGLIDVEEASDISVGNIVLFIEKGARVSEQEANRLVDNYMSQGGDFMTLMEWVIEKLEKSGFLGKPQEEKPEQEKPEA